MKTIESTLNAKPQYVELLGKEQASKLLHLFAEIESGKYDKDWDRLLQMNPEDLKAFCLQYK